MIDFFKNAPKIVSTKISRNDKENLKTLRNMLIEQRGYEFTGQFTEKKLVEIFNKISVEVKKKTLKKGGGGRTKKSRTKKSKSRSKAKSRSKVKSRSKSKVRGKSKERKRK